MSFLQKKRRTVSFLTIFAIAVFGLHLLVFLFLMIQGIKIRQLSMREPPNFVQLVDGRPIAVKDDLARDPQAIKQFIARVMTLMFNWSGTLPPQTIEEVTQPKLDRGIPIQTPQGGSNKVTTSSWLASFALSEDFRKGFLSEIAAMTPPEVFSSSLKQAMSAQLIIKRIYPPQEIAPGRWQVGIVADLVQKKTGDGRKIITPFNKDLLVRATDYFPYPFANKTTDLQKAIYSIRSDRLEIYEMRNLCLIDDYNSRDRERLNPCDSQDNSGGFIK
jgi:hypothetical protein